MVEETHSFSYSSNAGIFELSEKECVSSTIEPPYKLVFVRVDLTSTCFFVPVPKSVATYHHRYFTPVALFPGRVDW